MRRNGRVIREWVGVTRAMVMVSFGLRILWGDWRWLGRDDVGVFICFSIVFSLGGAGFI